MLCAYVDRLLSFTIARRISRVIVMSDRLFVCWSAVGCEAARSRLLTCVLSGRACWAQIAGASPMITRLNHNALRAVGPNVRLINPSFDCLVYIHRGPQNITRARHTTRFVCGHPDSAAQEWSVLARRRPLRDRGILSRSRGIAASYRVTATIQWRR